MDDRATFTLYHDPPERCRHGLHADNGDPVFVAYAVAAALMVLKLMGQGWMTVVLL